MMSTPLFLPGKQTVNSLHLPFMWMKQKKRLRKGPVNPKQQSVKMSWHLIQPLLYLNQENHWHLLIVPWMVVLVSFKEHLCQINVIIIKQVELVIFYILRHYLSYLILNYIMS